MENHHVQWVNPLFQWPFSIANCNKLPEGVYIYIYIYLFIYLDKHIMKIYIWTNTPNWRTPSFFRGVGQPPTSHILSYYPFYVIHLGIVTAPTSHAEKHCCAAAVAVKLGLLGIGAGEARRDFRGSHKRPRWRRMNSWRNGSRSPVPFRQARGNEIAKHKRVHICSNATAICP